MNHIAPHNLLTEASVQLDPAEVPAEVAADLLESLAQHSVEHALTEIQCLVGKLQRDVAEAAAARDALRRTPTGVLRDAMRLRAARGRADR